MNQHILSILYIIASVLFIIGLKMMGNAKTARKGNLLSAAGMILAIAGTILLHEGEVGNIVYVLILLAIIIGTIIGWTTARRVQMTKIPELVSMFNGMGGACAALISLIEFQHLFPFDHVPPGGSQGHSGTLICIISGLVIGSVSFAGSIIAFFKLNGVLDKPVRLPRYNYINLLILSVVAGISILLFYSASPITIYALLAIALLYGVMLVLPIGGADMPVVISLLNSFTGVAAAFGGFLYDNHVMLTGGILVGSAGTLLTVVMCKAMNRPIMQVIFGAFGTTASGSSVSEKGTIRDISVSDTAALMNYSKKVTIVPGYGLAVAQAQHAIHELQTILEDHGVEVKYAIHPVAGRMPGHMNVLLAEASVDYDKLSEMDDINPEFPNTDVVFVVGANDVVNPAAKSDPASPIFGMPILEAENARNIIINKRSMNAGYAGIDNLLFYNTKTSMLFGDAKNVITKLVSELKQM
ncbi:NAD(P)(+) transhydrogenase (Re/Si-specific) subunit beta [Pararcticibacter amylolyticus]|uniref:NAD(P) transhydrogenase subunit beta n=1 Tax=Pararcticibacter amylolyticus TaxID=2173175 RepID=A0A2U2PC08_9SPHI|nr:NAD(P)(+) transhydrogenase (Re/Si-specific) subunit beta [Pararcticibacter amylolyticus]PWG78659.1 NAD(P) transhydrogenase subunit beta [Pararcticibacter amylolyticus]